MKHPQFSLCLVRINWRLIGESQTGRRIWNESYPKGCISGWHVGLCPTWNSLITYLCCKNLGKELLTWSRRLFPQQPLRSTVSDAYTCHFSCDLKNNCSYFQIRFHVKCPSVLLWTECSINIYCMSVYYCVHVYEHT